MTQSTPTVGFVSLGCPKATFDSERILTQLRAEGYFISPTYTDADLVVVNTCGFIDAATEESLQAISEALDANGNVVVTGCLGARGDMIAQRFPQVIAVTGPDALDDVMIAVHKVLPPTHDPLFDLIPPGGIKLTPRHYAYLKIAEGCNQKCSFCIIPSMRGKLNSRPIGDILDEAEHLVSAGVRELLIVAQDTAAYGVDMKYRTDFWGGQPLKTRIHDLARHLGSLDAWIRVHYVYPYPHVDDLVGLMAEGALLPYLDVPMQHANVDILKAMRRPADSENMLRRIENWRQICSDIVLRSTFIVGFPGETEAQFNELLDFLDAAQLDRVGAFAYSAVEGAMANDLAPPLEEAVKTERLERFMSKQEAISAAKLQTKIGQSMTVLIDDITPEGIIARSAGDAPEIDGVVKIELEPDLEVEVGDFIDVEITDADAHDLYGLVMVGW